MSITVDLGGKRALVTGAGSGIGRACATRLAQAGAEVVVADVRPEAAAGVAAQIVAEAGHASAVGLDVTDWPQAVAVAAAQEEAGGLDVLVNCAATWKIGRFVEMEPDEWARDLAVTLGGTLTTTRALLPVMVASGGGAIINISSDSGRVGERNQAVYGAAKAGVIGFTKALAREVGRDGVRVNSVAPGLTRTPASESFVASMDADAVRRAYPLGRIGEPVDIADAVLFLASDLSSWVTGQVLSVSGGYSMVG